MPTTVGPCWVVDYPHRIGVSTLPVTYAVNDFRHSHRRGKTSPVEGWRAEVEVQVGYDRIGPYLLPYDEMVSLGRDPCCGLQVDNPKLSRVLATLSPSERGWVITNGKRTRMTAESPYIVQASFAPQAQLLLQPADWTLTWDLDVNTTLTVKYRRNGRGEEYPTARDKRTNVGRDRPNPAFVGTAVAGAELKLTPIQRRRLGALFAYLIEGTPKPSALIQAAAQRSGDTIPQVTRAWVRVMGRVNEHRDVPIETIEDLGYHLVEVAGVIGPDDVPQPRG